MSTHHSENDLQIPDFYDYQAICPVCFRLAKLVIKAPIVTYFLHSMDDICEEWLEVGKTNG